MVATCKGYTVGWRVDKEAEIKSNLIIPTHLDLTRDYDFTGALQKVGVDVVDLSSEQILSNKSIASSQLTGKTETWDEIDVSDLGIKYVDLPPEGWSRPDTNGAELYQVGNGTNNLVWNELRFVENLDKYAQRLYRMPSNYDGGNLTIKMVSKTPYDGSATSKVAKLIMRGIGRTTGEDFDPATGWVSNSQDLTVNLGAELPYETTFILTVSGEVVAGDILILQIQRDGNDAGDTLENVLKALDFELSFARAT